MPNRRLAKTAQSGASSRTLSRVKSASRTNEKGAAPRPRGRPRTDIGVDAVADAVAGLFAEGGMEAVSIVNVAEKLNVSRATLYRTVPTKQYLVGVLYERCTSEITALIKQVLDDDALSVEEKLNRMIEVQVDAAVRMRSYLPVFFGGGELPPDVFKRWHSWSRKFELMWVDCVSDAIDEGVLAPADPVITARLILGQCLWVSRWYRPNEGIETAEIAAAALALILPKKPASRRGKSPRPSPRQPVRRASRSASRR